MHSSARYSRHYYIALYLFRKFIIVRCLLDPKNAYGRRRPSIASCVGRSVSFLSHSIVTSAKAFQMKMWTYVWMGIWCWRALAHSYLLTNHDRIVFFFSSTVNQPWMLLRVDRLKWVLNSHLEQTVTIYEVHLWIYGFSLCSLHHPSITHVHAIPKKSACCALSPIDRFQFSVWVWLNFIRCRERWICRP